MNLVASAQNLFIRLRYPVSLPQDIGSALGVTLHNSMRFPELIQFLTSDRCIPTRLSRFMTKDKAEKAFEKAQRKEIFHQNILFSFYFTQGWLEFELQFDNLSLLRRIYVHHQTIKYPHGYELLLPETQLPLDKVI